MARDARVGQELSNGVTLFARSPALAPDKVRLVVTIPTFKRPAHLLRTIDSVKAQMNADTMAIIVMENEAEKREGATAAKALFDTDQVNGLVIIAHNKGNCHAYNAGWHTAMTQFPNLEKIAVIDDDEIADRHWLANMAATMMQAGADFAGGPQLPVFEGSPPEKWKTHPVFTPHYGVTGPVDILYSSGNLMLKADVLKGMPFPFLDIAFNFTGGGDADFMRRAKAKGKRFAWCNEAPVHETIPENRVTRDWITKRALRNGQLSALIEHRQRKADPLGRIKTIGKSIALACASIPRAAAGLIKTGSFLNAIYPIHIAAGRIASEFGYANEQYRNPQD